MLLNKYKIVAGLLLVLTTFIACEKKLDRNPFSSIDEAQALNTSSDVESALVGAYSQLGDNNVYGGGMFVYSELLGDPGVINWSGTFQGMTQIFNKAIPVDNQFAEDTWMGSYRAINIANNVLTAIDKVVDSKKDKVEGEAKFIRGSIYFDLVRLFAKAWNDGNPTANDGVPIILEPTRGIDDASKVARAKVSAVYDQVISDLTDAEELLPSSNGFFANKAAAAAMLARVYLQKGDFANAAAAANRVISNGPNSLMPTYAAAFPFNTNNLTEVVGNTREDVFAIQVTNAQGVNEFNTFFSQTGRGDIEIVASYFDQYEEGDERVDGAYYRSSGSWFVGKYDMVYGAVHIIRLAELYLIRAEANFRIIAAGGAQVGTASPAADINILRARAGLDPIDNEDLTLADILKERRLELAFEGHQLHDVKRLQQNVGSFPWNSPKLIFPIPDRERKVNSNLTQNEGY